MPQGFGGDRTPPTLTKLRLRWHGKRRARQLALTPSNGTLRPCPEDSLHWDTTQNLMIEGDNLEVLKLLQKSYAGKVKAIYIDPPYNTGTNLVYPNNYVDGIRTYLEVSGQIDGSHKLISNPESGGRFHSNWLSTIYPRLLVAKSLLRKDGVLFCAIDENEHSTLSIVMKEVFPEGAYEHAYVTIVHNPRGQQGKNISYVHENAVIVYPCDQQKYLSDVPKDEVDARNLRDSGTESDRTDARNCFYPIIVLNGRIVAVGDIPPDDFHPTSPNEAQSDGSIKVWPMSDGGDEKKWRYSKDSVLGILDKLEVRMGRTYLQIIFNKDSGTMRSVWQSPKYDSSEYGTKLVERLIGKAGFTFPKSLWAVRDALRIMTDEEPNAIVLDFYAGSGTTGHALWEVNLELGGNRRYILVQLPESLDPEDKEQRAAAEFCQRLNKPKNIAELTKERLRRASAKLSQDNPMFAGDVGFRVFKLDSTNIREWESNPEELGKNLEMSVEHIKQGRSEADILYELLLKQGLDLCVPIETQQIAGKDVHAVGGGALMVCLAERITKAEVEVLGQGIVAWCKSLAPASDIVCIFRDSAFVDTGDVTSGGDVAKTNMAAILQQNGIATIRSL